MIVIWLKFENAVKCSMICGTVPTMDTRELVAFALWWQGNCSSDKHALLAATDYGTWRRLDFGTRQYWYVKAANMIIGVECTKG